MGLLDFTPEQADSLLNFGTGLLAAGGPSRTPVSFGQAFAGGIGNMQQQEQVNLRQQALRQQMEQEQYQTQMMREKAEQERQDREAAVRRQEAVSRAISTMPQEVQTAVQAGVPFAEIWKHNNPEGIKPQLVTVSTPNGPMQRWLKPGETAGVDIGAPADKESALPWYVRKGQNGETMIDPAYADFERTKAAFGRAPAQPMQPVAYVDPASGQTVWGTITEAKGKPAANFSPTIQGQIAGAKESGKVAGDATAKAQIDLPSAVSQAEQAIKLSDELISHPGFKTAVGVSSVADPRNYIPGTDAKDFQIRLDQIKGQQFMQAYQSLKGGGQITEVEGKKATDAISRMNTAASPQEFKKAVVEFQGVIRQGVERAKKKAAPTQSTISSGGWSATVVK